MTPTEFLKKIKVRSTYSKSKGGVVQPVTRAQAVMKIFPQNIEGLSLNRACEAAGLNVSACLHSIKTPSQKHLAPSGREANRFQARNGTFPRVQIECPVYVLRRCPTRTWPHAGSQGSEVFAKRSSGLKGHDTPDDATKQSGRLHTTQWRI